MIALVFLACVSQAVIPHCRTVELSPPMLTMPMCRHTAQEIAEEWAKRPDHPFDMISPAYCVWTVVGV